MVGTGLYGIDSEEECLHGVHPQNRGAVGSMGVGSPCEYVLFGHPRDFNVLGTGS
jgi:hypothetical protein